MLGALLKALTGAAVTQGEILPRAQPADVEPGALPGQQFADVAEHTTAGRAPRPQEKKIIKPFPSDFWLDSRVLQQRLQLRAENQALPAPGKEQRLDANGVPRQKQAAGLCVPHGKGKNAVEPVAAVLAPL